MHDRRRHSRYGVRVAGKLMSPDISQSVDIVIRNLSESGALVSALAPADELPERLYLWQTHTRTLFECTVQWRNGHGMLGLRFTEQCSKMSVRELLAAVVPESDRVPAANAPARLKGSTAARSPALQVHPGEPVT